MAVNPTSGLAGALGSQTCTIYALDPSGTMAVEQIADIVVGVSPSRITIDTIDSESYQVNYRVTQHTLQDLTDTTSNVYRELIKLTVVGVFAAAGPMGVGSGLLPSSGLARLARLDLLRYRNLKNLADRRRPVMVVTPRVSLAACFITGIPTNWTPADGDSLPISLSFTEARIMRSESIAAYQDVDSLATGNNSSTGGGTGGSEVKDLTPESFAAIQGLPPLQPG
jgi:hypothetical protein